LCQEAYNSRSVLLATGAGLDGLVALNGIIRNPATYSTVPVTLTGTAFTLVTNGQVADTNGNIWNLPDSVTIGGGGTVTVTATAQELGAVTALAGTVTVILTPTAGWTSVTNPLEATEGVPAETDTQLRTRQAVSVANPSQALTTGILGAVLDVPNVVGAQIYENDTAAPINIINGVPNPGNYPANSITVVVAGGDNTAVAQAIYDRKTPGCYTNGTTSVTITDRYGVGTAIRFERPSDITIEVTINITARSGYNTTVGASLVAAVVAYINSLQGGQPVIRSQVEQAALSVITNATNPEFSLDSLLINRAGDTADTANIVMDFDEVAVTTTGDISLVVA
jgi:uncharacterized phage protein gp47/JayE